MQWIGAEAVRGEGLGEMERPAPRRGTSDASLHLSAASPGTRLPGDGSFGRESSSISHFLFSFPSSLLQLLAPFLLYLPVESSSQEQGAVKVPFTEPENGPLGKNGSFPFPALNLLLASRRAERNCVEILWVMGVGEARKGTLPGP